MVTTTLTILPDQERSQGHAKALMSGEKESTWELLNEGPKVEQICKLEFRRLRGRDKIPLEEIQELKGEFARSAGQNHLGFMHWLSLCGGPGVTPRSLNRHDLYFPATLWRHPDGALLIPFLQQGGRFDLWYLRYLKVNPFFWNNPFVLFAFIVS